MDLRIKIMMILTVTSWQYVVEHLSWFLTLLTALGVEMINNIPIEETKAQTG